MKSLVLVLALFGVLVAFGQDERFDINKKPSKKPGYEVKQKGSGLLKANRYVVGRKDIGGHYFFRPNGASFGGNFSYYISGKFGLDFQASFGSEEGTGWTLKTSYFSITGQYVLANSKNTFAIKPHGGFIIGSNTIGGFEVISATDGLGYGLTGGMELTLNVSQDLSLSGRFDQMMFLSQSLDKIQYGVIIRKTL